MCTQILPCVMRGFLCWFLLSSAVLHAQNPSFLDLFGVQEEYLYEVGRPGQIQWETRISYRKIAPAHSSVESFVFPEENTTFGVSFSFFQSHLLAANGVFHTSALMMVAQEPSLIRHQSVQADSMRNFFWEYQRLPGKVPVLASRSAGMIRSDTLMMDQVYFEEQLFVLARYVAWKQSSMQINLIKTPFGGARPPMPVFVTIGPSGMQRMIGGVACVVIVAQDVTGKTAEFYVTVGSSFRVIQARLFDDRWYFLKNHHRKGS
jgi:hypothetical protein